MKVHLNVKFGRKEHRKLDTVQKLTLSQHIKRFALLIFSYALAFWYGVKLIMDDREACCKSGFTECNTRYDASSLLIVFFSVLMGAMNVGQATPYVEAFSMAKGAAGTIFAVIDRKPEIDSLSEEGTNL